jgi:serine protease AprX
MRLSTVRWTAAAVLCAAMAGGTLDAPVALAATAPPKPPAVHVEPDKWGDKVADQTAKDVVGKNDPTKDPGSLLTVTQAIGARQLWGQKDVTGKAITGQGVTVALLDSGVAAVSGLNAAGKLFVGPDLSLETNSTTLVGGDNFGHGTFLAGLIAARDTATTDAVTGALTGVKPTDQLGVAPGASILAVKAATTDGSTDVTQIIAGLDWISQHRTDNGMNVRVVNLSFGTDSLQPYQVDPLAAAAENAWHHGIVVVVSGGNEGAVGRLTDPAIDPYVIAVGAADPLGTVGGWAKPAVATFSSVGSATRHVDLVAPGTSVVSLRDPGSFIDTNYPTGLVTGDTTGRLFRGSGSSQAAAVVSGAVALLLQQNPALTPDQVKALLVATADPMPAASAVASGAGELNVGAASKLVVAGLQGKIPASVTAAAVQTWPVGTGTGSLNAARGGNYLVDPDTGAVLSGEVDVQSQPWNGASWDAASAAGTSWNGGVWNGQLWSGNRWSGNRWSSVAWTGNRWSGNRWSSTSWDGNRWSGNRWSSNQWCGANW